MLVSAVIFFLLSTTSFSIVKSDVSCDRVNLLEETYVFSEPAMHTELIDGDVFSTVSLHGCELIADPGEPLLPLKGVSLLLPYNTKVKHISVEPAEPIMLGSGFVIPLAQESFTSDYSENTQGEYADIAVNEARQFYVGCIFEEVGTYVCRGYAILVLNLYPVRYEPISGSLWYYPKMHVQVELEENAGSTALLRGLPSDELQVSSKVDNPEIVSTYPKGNKRVVCHDDIDLLMITIEEFKPAFEPLRQRHIQDGIQTQIQTLTDIGSNDTESIRSYIREAYTDHGVDYVLIGGDHDIIPAKYLYSDVGDQGIPGDLYYTCLDGSFNSDGDDKWGEPTDGENGGDVDLFAEVSIGRACVGSIDEVEIFVNKTLRIIELDEQAAYLNDLCLVGEVLLLPEGPLVDDPDASGMLYMDELINETDANGYYTLGFPSADYEIEKVYDGKPGPWEKDEIIAQINNGRYVVNHLGHSQYDMNMRIEIPDIEALQNDELCFIYSQGCYAGGFDRTYDDCIAEYFTVKQLHGAFAVIMNTRSGWFVAKGTNGASQRYHREFWDAVFAEDIHRISDAHRDSKEDNVHVIGVQYMRFVYYELNLLGDPCVDFHVVDSRNAPPETPQRPSGDTSGLVDELLTFTTSGFDRDQDELFFMFDWGDDSYSEWLGPYKDHELAEASHKWSEQGNYEIKVKARDSRGSESNWSDHLGVVVPKNRQFFGRWYQWLLTIFQDALLGEHSIWLSLFHRVCEDTGL